MRSFFIVLFLLSAAHASSAQASSAEKIQDARACPRLFGPALSVEHNRALRQAQIENVEVTPRGVVIRHHVGRWRRPPLMRLSGMSLVGVQGSALGRRAVIELDGALAELCGAHRFSIGVDDALGSSGRVIAVLDDGLLVELGNALRLVPTPGAQGPAIEMIWSSDYHLVAAEGAGPTSSRASGSTRRPTSKTRRSEISTPQPLKSVSERSRVRDRSRRKARARSSSSK